MKHLNCNYIIMLALLTLSSLLHAQEEDNRVFKTYVYRGNKKELLKTEIGISNGKDVWNQKELSWWNKEVFQKRKYKRIKEDTWLKSVRMTMQIDLPFSSLPRCTLRENDSIYLKYLDSAALSRELAVYSWYARSDRFTLFHIKNKKSDSTYSTLKYETLYNYLLSLKEVGSLEGNPAYKTFTYSVTHVSLTANYLSKKEQKPYLYLTFCPQFGIVEYHYLKPNIHIRLETIDGKPLHEYIQKGLCVTPFCEIK